MNIHFVLELFMPCMSILAAFRTSMYLLHMEVSTLEGVRAMFYEYASRKAQQIAALSGELGLGAVETMPHHQPYYRL